MPIWNISTRVTHLREVHLPALGVTWERSHAKFVETLREVITEMPDNVRIAMTRYYVEGDSQQQDEVGLPVRTDGGFYNLLLAGRYCLATALRVLDRVGSEEVKFQ